MSVFLHYMIQVSFVSAQCAYMYEDTLRLLIEKKFIAIFKAVICIISTFLGSTFISLQSIQVKLNVSKHKD